LFHLILLAIVQGLTEFLPISSSAHLILLPGITGQEDQGLLIDVAVHVGSLFAVMVYFRRDVGHMFLGAGHILKRKKTEYSRLFGTLVVATIPTIFVGAILYLTGTTEILRNMEIIGWAVLIFGLILYEADRIGMRFKNITDMTVRGAIFIGLMQVLSLVPGTSRAGITITAGRFLGYERSEAARFSMLLSIPTIGIIGLLATVELIAAGGPYLQLSAFIVMVFSFIAAYASIWFFMRLVNRIGLLPFTIYRVVLGVGLLGYVYFIA